MGRASCDRGPERLWDVGAEETRPEQSGSDGPGATRASPTTGEPCSSVWLPVLGVAWGQPGTGVLFRRKGRCVRSHASDITSPPGRSSGVPDPDERLGAQRSDGTGQRGPRGPSRRRQVRGRNARPNRPPRACPRPRCQTPLLRPSYPHWSGSAVFNTEECFSENAVTRTDSFKLREEHTRADLGEGWRGDKHRTHERMGTCEARATRDQGAERGPPLRPQLTPLTPRGGARPDPPSGRREGQVAGGSQAQASPSSPRL